MRGAWSAEIVTTAAPARPHPPTGVRQRGRGTEDADLALLTGPDAVDIVASALVGDAPAPDGLTVQVEAVHHRPGVGVSVCYQVRWSGAASQALVASTVAPSRHEATDRVAVLDDGVRRLRVWRREDDPALPGLRSALTPSVVAGWLGRSGVSIEVLAYRPMRRAVVAAHADGAAVFVKVVRPRRVEDLLLRHELLAGREVPAPDVLGTPEPGVVLLAAAPGRSLAHALASGDPAQLPAPESVLAALSSLPDGARRLPRRPSWVDRLDFHAAAARSALPERAADVDRVEDGVTAVLAGVPRPETVATHGDLNVANLFVDQGRPSAFIDVDSLGPGRRDDDLATLLAHMAVLPSLAPEQYQGVPDVLEHWEAVFAATTDPRSLLARTAAVLVSLVAGAEPAQARARLDLALEAIGRADAGELP